MYQIPLRWYILLLQYIGATAESTWNIDFPVEHRANKRRMEQSFRRMAWTEKCGWPLSQKVTGPGHSV